MYENTNDENTGPTEDSPFFTPRYLRLPRTGSFCPWTGLSRSKLNQLILPCEANGHSPPVKSLCLRQRGALRGTRLILFESLMDHLQKQIQHDND